MRTNSKWSRWVLLVFAFGALLSFGGLGSAFRADDRAPDPESGSTFGRVRFLDGSMTLQRTADGEVAEATVNDPVAPGDRLTTEDGRAEIGLSDGSTVRLDRGTRLDVRNLADIDNRYESTNLLALERGAIRVDSPDPQTKKKTCRVDTEAGSVYVLSGGSFRIEMDEGVATLYSFRGVAELSGDDGSVLVRTGERSSVQPGRAPSEPRRFNTARLDDFDRFCETRQDAYVRHDADQPVDRVENEIPYEVHPYVNELSYYGSWRQVPDYGWVWRPVYYGSWGPYVNGYWSWCRSGWVWVSNDPWGWAPYHYGRWDFIVDTGWVWIPGRVWSGAWVSFAVGTSHIGWCPLNYYNRPVFQDAAIFNVVNVNVTRLQPRGWRFVPVEQFTNPRAPRTVVRVDRLPRGTDVVITSRLPRFNPRDVAGQPERRARFVETVRQTRTPLPGGVDHDNKPQPFRTAEARTAPEPRGRRGQPAMERQERPRAQRGHVDVQSGAPAAGPRLVAPRPEGTARPRGRTDGRTQDGARPQARPPEQPRDNRSRPQPADQGRGRDTAPRGNTHDDPHRSSAYSDQAIERLFDGVRGERGRPRIEPPSRVPPPQAPRPEMRPPSAPRPPQARPPAPRPQPKPKEGNGKSRGH